MRFILHLNDIAQLKSDLIVFRDKYPDFTRILKTSEYDLFILGIIDDAILEEYPVFCKNLIDSGSRNIKIYPGSYLMILVAHDKDLFFVNDPLGMLPLYYGRAKGKSFVSNSLSLIHSNCSGNLTLNNSVIWQNILFNYPVSNETYFKEARFLPAANVLKFTNETFSLSNYWDASQLMNISEVKNREGIDLIHESLKKSVSSALSIDKPVAVSLTGGWDGRLVLSYILKQRKDSFFTYSFGSNDFTDVKIPKYISRKVGFPYEHIVLNEDYIQNKYSEYARKTIVASDGFRPVNRAHYCYAVDKLGEQCKLIISGNGGSNLLKNIHSTGPIYNENIKTLFTSKTPEEALQRIVQRLQQKTPHLRLEKSDSQLVLDSLHQSMAFERVQGLSTNQLFYRFLIMHIERMYFGIEANSYLSKIFNYSPFFDIRFLAAVAKTSYFPGRYDYYSGDINQFFNQGKLYAELVFRNSPVLAKSITDRGYPLNYYRSALGRMMIYHQKFIKKYIYNKKDLGDGFATKRGNLVCINQLLPQIQQAESNFFLDKRITTDEILTDQKYLNAVSIINWLQEIPAW